MTAIFVFFGLFGWKEIELFLRIGKSVCMMETSSYGNLWSWTNTYIPNGPSALVEFLF